MPPLPKQAAAHRNVDVIAEPGRKRNVPTTPHRVVGLIKILHQPEAEHAPRTNRCDMQSCHSAICQQHRKSASSRGLIVNTTWLESLIVRTRARSVCINAALLRIAIHAYS